MIGDISIYEDIGQMLFNISPKDSVKTIIKGIDFSVEDSACSFTIDTLDDNGNVTWLTLNAKELDSLHDLLIMLRNSYIKEGQEAWSGCEFTLDIKTEKFKFNVEYKEELKGSG